VQPFPISVQNWSERGVPQGGELAAQIAQFKEQYHLEGVQIGIGVDRIDYTKGIAEKFRAVERFFNDCPQHRGRFTFVQLGAPSRTHIRRYRELIAEMEALADSINWSCQTEEWKPIRFLVAHHDGPTVHAFLRMACVCVVSSLHDGMNLVAKEFVAAQEECEGVLVLSEFAGAARELSDAIIVNPYDTKEIADAIRRAVEMSPQERRERMGRMRTQVESHNIYRWAATFLSTLGQTGHEPGKAASGHVAMAPETTSSAARTSAARH
jgi:trehalose 6-phosphate synthase